MDPFHHLDSDSLQHVFGFLEPQDYIRCERVNKTWQYFCRCWIQGPGLSLHYPLEKTRFSGGYKGPSSHRGISPIDIFKRRARFESALAKGHASYFEKYHPRNSLRRASGASPSPTRFAASGAFVTWTWTGQRPLELRWKTLPAVYNRDPPTNEFTAYNNAETKQVDLADVVQLTVADDIDLGSFALEDLKLNRKGTLYARIQYRVRQQQQQQQQQGLRSIQREIFYSLPTGTLYADINPKCSEGEDFDDWIPVGLGRRLVYYINRENTVFSAFDFISGAHLYKKNLVDDICGRKSLLSVEIPESNGSELVILPHADPSFYALDKRFQVSVMEGETGCILQRIFLPGHHYESHSFSYGTSACTFCTEICLCLPRSTGKPPITWISLWHTFRFNPESRSFSQMSTRALLPPSDAPARRLQPYLKNHALSFGAREDQTWLVHELQTVNDRAYLRELKDAFKQACPELDVDSIWLPVNSNKLTLAPAAGKAGARTPLDTEEHSNRPQSREQVTWRRPGVMRLNTRYFWFSKNDFDAVVGF